MGTEQFLAADRDRFPLKVQGQSDFLKECRGAQAIGAWDRASLWVSAADVLHAKQCSTCKDANSLAGAVGIEAEVTLAQRAKVAEAKPSERSTSGVKRA